MSDRYIIRTTGQTGPVDTTAQTALAAHLADTSDAHDASAISVLDTAGNYAGDDAEEIFAELPTKFRPGGEYFLADYGTVSAVDGAANTTTLNAAMAAMFAAGGGKLIFPEGDIPISGQIVLPSDNATATGATRQPPYTWIGQGAHASGQNELGSGGTRLILTYAGGSYNAAKIVTYGLGLFTARDINFVDTTANATTPFIYTTNTTLNIAGCAFMGATADTACQQDAIVLGGTTKPISTGYGDANSAFQGYGTVIRENYFNKVRRAVYGRSYCNQVQVVFNYMDKDCGTNLAGGAVVEFDGSLDPVTSNVGDVCLNNVVMGNYMHAINYVYGVKVIKGVRNVIAFNGFIDAGVAAVAVTRFEGVNVSGTDYASSANTVIGNATQNDVHLSEDAMSAGRNFLVGQSTTEPAILGSLVKMPRVAELRIDTPAAGVANWKITDSITDYLALVIGAGGKWQMGGPLELVGNSTNAGTTALTLGNNSRAADATINLNAPSGQVNQIQFKRAGSNSWLFYDANSTLFFVRDSVNGVMQMTLNPGSASTGRIDLGVKLRALATAGIEMGSGGPLWRAGTGSPEGAVTAPVGSLWTRTDGGAGTSLYVKESGTDNTGWVAK